MKLLDIPRKMKEILTQIKADGSLLISFIVNRYDKRVDDRAHSWKRCKDAMIPNIFSAHNIFLTRLCGKGCFNKPFHT